MNFVVDSELVEPCSNPARRLTHRSGAVLPWYQPVRAVVSDCQVPANGSLTPEPDGQPSRRSQAMIRVLLADDHAIVRDSLARLLQMQEGIEVVGRAGDGQEAVDLAMTLKPDVIVMDVSMPRLNGIQATSRIKTALPYVCVIGLSMHRQADMAANMKAAGASQYLAKTSAPAELIQAIRTCMHGDAG